MRKLAYLPKMKDTDLLTVVYYMLLQDRVSEALVFFKQIDPRTLHTRLQYDYLQVYLNLYKGDIDDARNIAAQYSQFAIPRWQKLFQIALSQLDELKGESGVVIDDHDHNQVHQASADTAPFFDFNIDAQRVMVSFPNISQFTVNYYPMEIELLFSRNPFLKEQSGAFAFIRPGYTQHVELSSKDSHYSFELPDELQNKNMMVEVVSMGIRETRAYYASSLDTLIFQNFEQLKVIHKDNRSPLPKSYVKVYAWMKTGAIQFYKDGYTDQRGRFDYTTLSSDELDRVEKFAILVNNDDFGSEIKEVLPPMQ